jgi:pimeloyl-ACP methyl ester carboxylesterase
LDVLLDQPRVDKKRVAYVGHDFGMMYGAVLAGTERRVHVWALQAGTTSFSDWFLFLPERKGEDRRKFTEELAPLDPVKHIGKAVGAPVLMQFGKSDPYVPVQKAQEFYDAAKEPKKILWYDAGHALNADAIRDRQAWLKEQLHLNKGAE